MISNLDSLVFGPFSAELSYFQTSSIKTIYSTELDTKFLIIKISGIFNSLG